jgi:hypothetical protein
MLTTKFETVVQHDSDSDPAAKATRKPLLFVVREKEKGNDGRFLSMICQ